MTNPSSTGASPAHDALLYTPGPLTTSAAVKMAMLQDLGSRDPTFLRVVADVRHRLVALAGASDDRYTAVPMQGSGTFAIEAAIGSLLPRGAELLVAVNGAYGRRMADIATRLGIPAHAVEARQDEAFPPDVLAAALEAHPGATHVGIVHCETTTGALNPLRDLARIARDAGRTVLVDAMSSLGAVPIDVEVDGIDVLVSSANKCIEGVPGFAFVVARRDLLEGAGGWARSVSLDLVAQWRGLETDGQFRFTPPTHAILAFQRALDELEAEGGMAGRMARYRANHEVLMAGMERLGFASLIRPADQSWILTTFLEPDDPAFDFGRVYAALAARGHVLYPGKLADVASFRIGTIGRLFPADIAALLAALGDVLAAHGVPVPVSLSAATAVAPGSPVRVVILDWAGTTVDHGSRAPIEALSRLFASLDLAVTEADLRVGMGLHKRDHIATVLRSPHVADAWRLRHARPPGDDDAAALYEAFLPLQQAVVADYAAPIDGALDAVAWCRERGIAIGTTTGYTRPMMDVLVPAAARHGFRPDLVMTPDEVAAGRPAPHMCLEIVRRLGGIPPWQAVKVGDTVHDVEEGRQAGMWTVAVAATGNEVGLSGEALAALPQAEAEARIAAARARLRAAGADDVIDGIAQLPAAIERVAARLVAGERPWAASSATAPDVGAIGGASI